MANAEVSQGDVARVSQLFVELYGRRGKMIR
jgi:hypothetical protein